LKARPPGAAGSGCGTPKISSSVNWRKDSGPPSAASATGDSSMEEMTPVTKALMAPSLGMVVSLMGMSMLLAVSKSTPPSALTLKDMRPMWSP
jgi:hypothetical protein